MHLRHGLTVKLSRNERALDVLGFQKKNVWFLTRARLGRRNVPSTVAGLRVSTVLLGSRLDLISTSQTAPDFVQNTWETWHQVAASHILLMH